MIRIDANPKQISAALIILTAGILIMSAITSESEKISGENSAAHNISKKNTQTLKDFKEGVEDIKDIADKLPDNSSGLR